MTAAFRFR